MSIINKIMKELNNSEFEHFDPLKSSFGKMKNMIAIGTIVKGIIVISAFALLFMFLSNMPKFSVVTDDKTCNMMSISNLNGNIEFLGKDPSCEKEKEM